MTSTLLVEKDLNDLKETINTELDAGCNISDVE